MKAFLSMIAFAILLGGCQKQDQPFDGHLAWQEFEQMMVDNYAYLDTEQVDSEALFKHYKPHAQQAKNKAEFNNILKVVVRFFIDPHLNIGPLNSHDYSVTPTGSDIWAMRSGHHYIIEDIKVGSSAAKSGLKVGQVITAIDGYSTSQVIQRVFADTQFPLSEKHQLWAINIALGGLRNAVRVIDVQEEGVGQVLSFKLAASYEAINALKKEPVITARAINGVGYIRLNNGLGNEQTAQNFKTELSKLLDTKGLIIDLRNTPSGGNTGVAEPILGHFVKVNTPYQAYQIQQAGQPYVLSEMQFATADPKAPYYSKPFVVLAGRWTGSMGEGMVIGLDALGAKAVIGAPMADLLGGINRFELSHSDSSIDIGFERLFHLNGSYREDFLPDVLVLPADTAQDGDDPALKKALELLGT